jgi:hypothetical protein
MISQSYYLLRSRQDGQYLVARPRGEERDPDKAPPTFLLLFQEHADALSYLNQHGAGVADQFGVETLSAPQLRSLMQRMGFQGIGLVEEPLQPRIEFLSRI